MMFISLTKGLVMDKVVEQAFETLVGTFSDEQALAYTKVENACDRASTWLYGTMFWIPLSLIGTNVLFWMYDYSFFLIFMALMSYPYLVYKTIKVKGYAYIGKAKFYATLSKNVETLGGDAKDAFKTFTARYN